MISTKSLVKMARKWQKMAARGRRISLGEQMVSLSYLQEAILRVAEDGRGKRQSQQQASGHRPSCRHEDPRAEAPSCGLPASTHEASFAQFLSDSGTFRVGDLLVNRDGLRILPDGGLDSPAPLQLWDPHFSLADFDTIKVIGKGNGGVVQLVRHKLTSQFFALKVIQMNVQESIRRQIVQELKINKWSQCPHIVVCHHAFYDNGVIKILFEYMDGGSLSDLIKKVGSIPEAYLSAICKQVLKGLIYLHHEKHIIHRDIKPSNLLVNHVGEVKITDFGVSAILDRTSGLRGTVVGTYTYMSPERINAEVYGYKSDIWSLGLVLLECATGSFPYTPVEKDKGWTNVFELLEAVVYQPSPHAPSDQFTPEFCSFISACMQKKPEDRPSAQKLLNHDFITKHECPDVNLASYLSSVGSPLATF